MSPNCPRPMFHLRELKRLNASTTQRQHPPPTEGLTKRRGNEMSPSRLKRETCPTAGGVSRGPYLSPPRLTPNCSTGTKAAREETPPRPPSPKARWSAFRAPSCPLLSPPGLPLSLSLSLRQGCCTCSQATQPISKSTLLARSSHPDANWLSSKEDA